MNHNNEYWENNPKGSMGWPGGTLDSFPKWAIDIIQFRNKKRNDDTSKNVDIEYDKLDSSLNEMINFIMIYYK